MGTISISNLNKEFGAFKALTDINLSIGDGEFLVLVGPSGCGKSTLLRTLAGLETVSAGTISIDERDVTDLPAKSRDIAMVFQSYALYPHMTVAQNMGFSLRLRKFDKATIEEGVKAAAAILNLEELLDRRPGQLSGGQRQRVAMGRAIVRDPEVFLFDEPLSNLDAKLRVVMRSEIKALHQRLRTTTVYVTHDQIEALTMADRIVVMRAGKIEQVGTPGELYEKPVNTFVAEFIGSPAINLISAKAEAAGPSLALSAAGGIQFKLPDVSPATVGTDVLVGIRPEDIRFEKGEGAWPATVDLVEPMGSQSLIICSAAGLPLTVLTTERTLPTVGDTVMLSAEPDALHLFDATTKTRL